MSFRTWDLLSICETLFFNIYESKIKTKQKLLYLLKRVMYMYYFCKYLYIMTWSTSDPQAFSFCFIIHIYQGYVNAYMIYQKHFTVLLIAYIFLTSSGEIDICSNHDNCTGENKVYSRADFYLVRHTVPQTEANRNNMAPAPDKNPVVNPS